MNRSHCGRFQPIVNRRHFLQRAGGGMGMLALADLLSQSGLLAAESAAPGLLSPRKGHFPARAQSVIWLFMEGAPSAVDIFDPKPELDKRDGQRIEINVFNGDPGPLMKSPFRFQQYAAIHSPNTPATVVTSSQWKEKWPPWKFGMISQWRSTKRITRKKLASSDSRDAARFNVLESSIRNGKMKCPNASSRLTGPQPFEKRRIYQGISSGRFADQMIRNCENARYAHSIVNANRSFP